jgi:hypothetical protein
VLLESQACAGPLNHQCIRRAHHLDGRELDLRKKYRESVERRHDLAATTGSGKKMQQADEVPSRGLQIANHRSEELYRLISTADTEELRILVKNTPAQPFLESGNERMFGSIRSVASANVSALEHVAEQSSAQLSVSG